MESVEKPFDIKKRSYMFSKTLVGFIQSAKYDRIVHPLFDQLLRSGTSIGANLVEGGSGSSRKDVLNFYCIALKSANESKYWLCLIRDTVDCDKEVVGAMIKEADEISKIVASSIIKMRNN